MRKTRLVVVPASGHAAMRGGANRQTFSPEMATQIKSPKKLPDNRERDDESTDRPGAALWSSVFAFLMEGFAAYGAAVHGVSIGAVLNAARRPHPWSARRAPISAERGHGSHPISENGHVDGNWLSSQQETSRES
jgi:hypothetical protein